jgi:hypothetical protein
MYQICTLVDWMPWLVISDVMRVSDGRWKTQIVFEVVDGVLSQM